MLLYTLKYDVNWIIFQSRHFSELTTAHKPPHTTVTNTLFYLNFT